MTPRLALLMSVACAPAPSTDAIRSGNDTAPPASGVITDTASPGLTGTGDDASRPTGTETGVLTGTPTGDHVAPTGDSGDSGEPRPRAERLVIAGDSWSTGLVQPLRNSLDEGGYADVAITWEFTANAGSEAEQWAQDEHPPGLDLQPDTSRPRMLTALHAALDASPPADVLVLVLGGNDLNREADEGFGGWPGWRQDLTMDAIADDLAAVVDAARAGRPDLDVVLFGYSYFHQEFLTAFGLDLSGFDTTTYNEAVIDLEAHKRDLAATRPGVWWSHHLGLLQHHHGDTIHPPFSRPNPLTGYPEYTPGIAPAPGTAPSYDPFPGGFYTYPAPLDLMPDGIHPSEAGMRVLADHLRDHGLGRRLEGGDWAATTP